MYSELKISIHFSLKIIKLAIYSLQLIAKSLQFLCSFRKNRWKVEISIKCQKNHSKSCYFSVNFFGKKFKLVVQIFSKVFKLILRSGDILRASITAAYYFKILSDFASLSEREILLSSAVSLIFRNMFFLGHDCLNVVNSFLGELS